MADNPVQRAVDILGGELETQIAIRVKYWTLRDWLRNGVVPKTADAVALSEATGGRVSVKELAGSANGNGDDDPTKGRTFLKGGKMSATYPELSPSLPVVPRFPDTAARAA